MNLLLFGLSHHTAPVELREQLAIPEAHLPDAVRGLMQEPGVREGLILSTCNRFELITATDERHPDLAAVVARLHGRELSEVLARSYERRSRHAVQHVFRVASSLDSLIVGEPQILGQMKQAWRIARELGAVHSNLDALMTRAFQVAKRVRTETQIANNPVSISRAAIELAKQIFGDLRNKTILLIGAGKMGSLAARHLMSHGAQRLLVVSRTLERSRAVAAQVGGEAFEIGELYRIGHLADVIVSSTGAAELVLRRADVEQFLHRRKRRAILLLDIAVPRDIDPEVNRLENVFLYNIDDLQAVVDANIAERQREAARAEAIIENEVEKFFQRLQIGDAAPLIRALQRHADNLRREELRRARGKLGKLTPEQERAVESLSYSLMQKWLHKPMTEMKAAISDGSGLTLLEAAERMFGLKCIEEQTECLEHSPGADERSLGNDEDAS